MENSKMYIHSYTEGILDCYFDYFADATFFLCLITDNKIDGDMIDVEIDGLLYFRVQVKGNHETIMKSLGIFNELEG